MLHFQTSQKQDFEINVKLKLSAFFLIIQISFNLLIVLTSFVKYQQIFPRGRHPGYDDLSCNRGLDLHMWIHILN